MSKGQTRRLTKQHISSGGAVGIFGNDFIKKMKLYTAMEFYKMQKLLMGKASEVAEMNKTDFMFELGKHEIPVINYDTDDFKDGVEWIMKK